MRFFTNGAALALGVAQVALAQQGVDLGTAIASNPNLSSFGQILSKFPGLVSSLIPQAQEVTVLVPSNAAFEKFVDQTGQEPTSLPTEQLVAIFKYHVMAAKLTSKNFTARRGIVVPTLLKDEQYNNRSAGAQLVNTFGPEAAQGNVLYISPDTINPAKLRVRQAGNSSTSVNLRGGLGVTASVDAVDGEFGQGAYQIIDT